MQAYYNTNKLNGKALTDAYGKARGQEEIILEFFQNNPYKECTPEEVWRLTGLDQNNVPLTSIRRAMSNLTNDEKNDLIKTDKLVDGRYGSPIHKWKLNISKHKQPDQPTQLEIFE